MTADPDVVDVYWRLPTHGDPATIREPRTTRGDWNPPTPGTITPGWPGGRADRFSYVDHLADIARAAEISGFYGALIPSFPMTDDPWVISPAIAEETRTLRFMIAFQPGFLDPVHAARMSASLQRLSGGRLVFNVITGGGGPDQLWWGDPTSHDDRYVRTSEFLDVFRGVWDGGPFDFDGRFYRVERGGLPARLRGEELPEIYFSGSSDAAIAAAGRHADYYLSWLEPFDDLREKFDQVRARTAAQGRAARFAVRVDVHARATDAEAWGDIAAGLARVDPGATPAWSRSRSGTSVGAARLARHQPGTVSGYEDLIIAPNVWAGFHHLRGGPPLGLVGDYATVAEQLDRLVELGVDAFILAGVPHLEEAYRVGEEVLPLLRARRRAPETFPSQLERTFA